MFCIFFPYSITLTFVLPFMLSLCIFSFICRCIASLSIYVCQFSLYYDYFCRVTEEVVNESEKNLEVEKPVVEEVADGSKESPVNGPEEKEPEDKVNGCHIHNILSFDRSHFFPIRNFNSESPVSPLGALPLGSTLKGISQ